ncbi:hypothetical protein [Guggenheimella bovis]
MINFDTISKRLGFDFWPEYQKYLNGEYGDEAIFQSPIRLLTDAEKKFVVDFCWSNIKTNEKI